MTTPYLWDAMKAAGGDEAALLAAVRSLNREQLIYLHRQYGIAAGELNAIGVPWAVATWAVGRGRKVWFDARSDPSALPSRPPPGAPDLLEALRTDFRTRFGEEIPEQEPDPANDPDLCYDPTWEQKLWDLVDVVNVGVPLDDALVTFTRSDLVRLDFARRVVTDRIIHKLVGISSDRPDELDWLEVAEWLVGQGRDRVESVLANPTEALQLVPDDDSPLFVDRLVLAYRNRYGNGMARIPLRMPP